MNSPGNPTGTLISNRDFAALIGLAEARRVLLISDEVYWPFVYGGGTCFSRGLRDSPSVVHIRSFSKVFGMAGERLGYAMGPPELISAMRDVHWSLAMNAPASAQRMAIAALGNQPKERIESLVSLLAEKRKIAMGVVAESPHLDGGAPAGGFFLWIRATGDSEERALDTASFVEESRVQVVPGVQFGEKWRSYFRASFAVPDRDIVEGLNRAERWCAAHP